MEINGRYFHWWNHKEPMEKEVLYENLPQSVKSSFESGKERYLQHKIKKGCHYFHLVTVGENAEYSMTFDDINLWR